MCLGAQRSKRHTRCDEPLSDRGDRLDLFNRNRLTHRLDVQKVPQMDRRVGLHRLAILLPQIEARAGTGGLQHVHGLRFPGVFLARTAGLIETTNRQDILTTAPAQLMNLFDLGLNAHHADTRDPRLHAGEELVHHRTGQANRLEVQAAPV